MSRGSEGTMTRDADLRTDRRGVGSGAGVGVDAHAGSGAADTLPAWTWTRESAAGTPWWGCRACAKRHPALTASGAAAAAERHARGPVHRRNVARLNGEDTSRGRRR